MQKIRRGSGFYGLFSYLLDHDDPEFIFGTVTKGTAKEIVREFISLANTRKDIKKPVWHNSLRLPAGEHLSNDKWSAIAIDYMSMMGLGNAQYAVIKQNKPDGEHIHIGANRVLPDGSIYLGKNENLKSTKIIAELERKYGLKITRGVQEGDGLVAKLSKNEIEKAIRTGVAPTRSVLQKIIDEALNDNPDIYDFTERLFIAGVTTKPSIESTGNVNGLTFNLNGLNFSGAKLGRKYVWSQLQRHLDYSPERDYQLLKKLKETALINDEIRTGTSANQHSIDIDGKADKDSKKVSVRNDRYYQKVKSGISDTKTQFKNFTAESGLREQTNKQIKYADGVEHPTPNLSHFNKFNYVNKEVSTMSNETEIKRKKRQLVEDEMFVITGKKRTKADAEKYAEEQRRFLKTIDLAFDKRGNEYFSKKSGLLAFTETEDQIVGGEGLINKDGTFNEAAMKAMKQAAKLKFGDTFKSTGSRDYVRESWFATAKIGCLNTGYEPMPADYDRLIEELKKHESKYGRQLRLHPKIIEQIQEHKNRLNHVKMHMKSLDGGKSEAEIAKSEKNRLDELKKHKEAYGNKKVADLVGQFRAKREQENDKGKTSKLEFMKPSTPRPFR